MVPPNARSRLAMASTSCVVLHHRRNPTPFSRWRPLAKSSWVRPSSQAPAFSCTPLSFPPSSQRSPTKNPSPSRYQARLRSISLTVKLGMIVRSRRVSGCWRFGWLNGLGWAGMSPRCGVSGECMEAAVTLQSTHRANDKRIRPEPDPSISLSSYPAKSGALCQPPADQLARDGTERGVSVEADPPGDPVRQGIAGVIPGQLVERCANRSRRLEVRDSTPCGGRCRGRAWWNAVVGGCSQNEKEGPIGSGVVHESSRVEVVRPAPVRLPGDSSPSAMPIREQHPQASADTALDLNRSPAKSWDPPQPRTAPAEPSRDPPP